MPLPAKPAPSEASANTMKPPIYAFFARTGRTAAGAEHQHGRGDHVDEDHPHQLQQARVQAPLEIGQRDDQRARVDRRQQHPEAGARERPPLVVRVVHPDADLRALAETRCDGHEIHCGFLRKRKIASTATSAVSGSFHSDGVLQGTSPRRSRPRWRWPFLPERAGARTRARCSWRSALTCTPSPTGLTYVYGRIKPPDRLPLAAPYANQTVQLYQSVFPFSVWQPVATLDHRLGGLLQLQRDAHARTPSSAPSGRRTRPSRARTAWSPSR